MNEIELRQLAVRRCMAGEKPALVATEIKRTKQWIYKWLKRYKTGDKEWYLSRSRSPKKKHGKISRETEVKIIQIRKELSEMKYSQTGALSIQYEFNRLGLNPPATWTINRVLKRNGLIQKSKRRTSKNIAYPELYLSLQQMDLVGPRYLKGGFRFYAFNIIDTETHRVHVHPMPDKTARSILGGIISFWQDFGMPDALQMDNELSFRGSNRHPRSLGVILRFVISQGVVPIFIPRAEPWRNGVIEKFNGTFNSKFYRVQKFKDFGHLKNEAAKFEEFHNQHHRYSSQGNKTPNEMLSEIMMPQKLSKDYLIEEPILLDSGVIIFVRFVRSDLKVNVFNSKFTVNKKLMYSYIIAEIIIDAHCLLIKQDNKIYHSFTFIMPVDW